MMSNDKPADAKSGGKKIQISIGVLAVYFLIIGIPGLVFYDPKLTTLVGSSVFVGIYFGAVAAAVLSLKFSGYIRRGCGCVLNPYEYGFETVESELEWERRRDGEKVVWEQYRTEMRRCEKCGDHYHAEIDEPVETREMWPEEEPEQKPQSPGSKTVVEVEA